MGWFAPSNIAVPALGGQSLFGAFSSSIGNELAHFPTVGGCLGWAGGVGGGLGGGLGGWLGAGGAAGCQGGEKQAVQHSPCSRSAGAILPQLLAAAPSGQGRCSQRSARLTCTCTRWPFAAAFSQPAGQLMQPRIAFMAALPHARTLPPTHLLPAHPPLTHKRTLPPTHLLPTHPPTRLPLPAGPRAHFRVLAADDHLARRPLCVPLPGADRRAGPQAELLLSSTQQPGSSRPQQGQGGAGLPPLRPQPRRRCCCCAHPPRRKESTPANFHCMSEGPFLL